MRKLFLTSGIVLCMACPAFAVQDINANINAQTGEVTSYTLATSGEAPDCSTPDTLLYDNAPTTFYAKWTAHGYTVNYYGGTAKTAENEHSISGSYSDTGNAVFNKNYTVLGNTDAALGTAFAQTGYHFTGWMADNNIVTPTATPLNADHTADGTAFQPGATPLYKVVGDVNMYAQWAPNEFDMTYDSGARGKLIEGTQTQDPAHNNTYVDPTKIVYDTTYTIKGFGSAGAGFVADEGYTFRGWSFDENATYDPENNTLLQAGAMSSIWTQNAGDTLYAIYSANKVTLTYDCGGVTVANVGKNATKKADLLASVTYERTYDASAANLFVPADVCELGGYHVDGTWNCVLTGTDTEVELADVQGIWKVDGNVTCSLEWEANTIGLAWDAGQGATANTTNAGGSTCTYDSTINVAGKPTKAGYDFQGWTTKTTGLPADTFVFPSDPAPTPGTTVTSQGNN